jgi:hypothetical protein
MTYVGQGFGGIRERGLKLSVGMHGRDQTAEINHFYLGHTGLKREEGGKNTRSEAQYNKKINQRPFYSTVPKGHIGRAIHGRDRHGRRDCIAAAAGCKGAGEGSIEWYAIHTLDALDQRKGVGRRGRQGCSRTKRDHCIVKGIAKVFVVIVARSTGREREGHGHRRVSGNIDQAHRRGDRHDLL